MHGGAPVVMKPGLRQFRGASAPTNGVFGFVHVNRQAGPCEHHRRRYVNVQRSLRRSSPMGETVEDDAVGAATGAVTSSHARTE